MMRNTKDFSILKVGVSVIMNKTEVAFSNNILITGEKGEVISFLKIKLDYPHPLADKKPHPEIFHFFVQHIWNVICYLILL